MPAASMTVSLKTQNKEESKRKRGNCEELGVTVPDDYVAIETEA